MIRKTQFARTLAVTLWLLATAAGAQAQTKALKISDVSRAIFRPELVWGLNPMADGQHYSTDDPNGIAIYQYTTGAKTRTISPPLTDPIEAYAFSSDQTKLLLTTKTTAIYRHSFVAKYWIYDIATSRLTELAPRADQQLATFSPDGTKVAFVRANNLYIKDLTTQTETPVTTDGTPNQIINGAPDWVYEEEFGFSQAYQWANDSKTIAYYRFDETAVPQFDMSVYDGLYPTVQRFKYPKAGEVNSKITLLAYHPATAQTTTLDIGTETDLYIPRIKWSATPGQLAIARLNRLQNKLELLLADTQTGTSRTIYTETNPRYYDYEDLDRLTFLPEGKQFLITSEKNGWRHYYLIDIATGTEQQLTSGNYDITAHYGYDPRRREIYYQAATPMPTQREVWATSLRTKKTRKLSTQAGTTEAHFSSNYDYYIATYSTANTPHQTTLYRNNATQVRTLQDNAALRKNMTEYQWSPLKFFQFRNDDSTLLYGYTIRPPKFDSTQRHPILVYQYSGPNSQTATDEYYGGFTEWFQMLAQKGYVIVVADPRGTGARGQEFRKQTYLQLGKYETEDFIALAQYLRQQDWTDALRLGIFGWSYGGFMSTLAMLRGGDYYTTGIAVAPVTNWRYYDNIYTERYMRTPQENPDGYDDNSPINHVSRLQGNFLLVHGTGDDNVHLQNTLELTKELIGAAKQFDLMLYPNENHSIRSSRPVRQHLIQKLTDFILTKL